MAKDFDTWNALKKVIDSKDVGAFCNPREIWWASIGLNVGSEEDGKNDQFERPVLIVKVFNRRMVRILPLTSKVKDDANHLPVNHIGIRGSVILSHMKTISTKRITRKMFRIGTSEFMEIIEKARDSLS